MLAVSDRDAERRRWLTLVVVVVVALMAALDTTVLNVAIPTIMREFRTDLSAIQWVVTGYALTFASLLILCGRLADVLGARRLFIAGLVLFGTGSALAALSTSVPTLLLGEAAIEGIGAAMMTPASLSILSNTFTGPERPVAFSAWGTTAGLAVVIGPILGGWLTTTYSWRWSFGINVVVAPLAIVAALLVVPPDGPLAVRGGLR